MKAEELYSTLSDVFRDRAILWLSIEEAKTWGFNIIYYTLAVEPYFILGAAAFEFILSNEELIPIAVVLQLSRDSIKEITIDKISKVIKSIEGYIFGATEDIGILIPLNEYELSSVFKKKIPYITKQLFNYELIPVIDGYFFDLARF